MPDKKASSRHVLKIDASLDGIVKIDLFGVEFRFRSDNDGPVEPQKVAEALGRYVVTAEEQMARNTSSEKNKIAVLLLAAMNISSDLCELRSEYARLETHVSKRVTKLLNKVNREFP